MADRWVSEWMGEYVDEWVCRWGDLRSPLLFLCFIKELYLTPALLQAVLLLLSLTAHCFLPPVVHPSHYHFLSTHL